MFPRRTAEGAHLDVGVLVDELAQIGLQLGRKRPRQLRQLRHYAVHHGLHASAELLSIQGGCEGPVVTLPKGLQLLDEPCP